MTVVLPTYSNFVVTSSVFNRAYSLTFAPSVSYDNQYILSFGGLLDNTLQRQILNSISLSWIISYGQYLTCLAKLVVLNFVWFLGTPFNLLDTVSMGLLHI